MDTATIAERTAVAIRKTRRARCGNGEAKPQQTALAVAASDDPALAVLAARADAEHRQVGAAANGLFDHAVECGRVLIEAKGKLPHGRWLPWLRANTMISVRCAQLYMKLARHYPESVRKNESAAFFTISEAVLHLDREAAGKDACRLAEDQWEWPARIWERCRLRTDGALARLPKPKEYDRLAEAFSLARILRQIAETNHGKAKITKATRRSMKAWAANILDAPPVEIIRRFRVMTNDTSPLVHDLAETALIILEAVFGEMLAVAEQLRASADEPTDDDGKEPSHAPD